MYQQIVLRDLTTPRSDTFEKEVNWLCESFGFVEGRDTERISSRVLQSLLREIVDDGHTSTSSLADDLNIAAQRVNYHLRSLAEAGFIYRERKLIFLREGGVQATVEQMRKDANRIFDKLSQKGAEIDATLGLQKT